MPPFQKEKCACPSYVTQQRQMVVDGIESILDYPGVLNVNTAFFFFFSFVDSSERGREGGREGEKQQREKETLILSLIHI